MIRLANAHKSTCRGRLSCSHLKDPGTLGMSWLIGVFQAIGGQVGDEQVGEGLAHVEGDGPIERELRINHEGGVLGDHEAASVLVSVQQRLHPLHELCLHTACSGLKSQLQMRGWCSDAAL